MRRLDSTHPPLVFEAMERIQTSPDGDEVMDLVELDMAAEVALGGLDLALRLPVVGGPHLGSNDGPPAAMLSQRIAQNPLCLAVHGGGVEEIRSFFEGRPDDLVALLFLATANVEGLPGPQANGGDLRSVRSQSTASNQAPSGAKDSSGRPSSLATAGRNHSGRS